MLQLLAELYATCPEEGDLDKPKLVMFIDEAHLIFQEANACIIATDRNDHQADPFKRNWYLFLYPKPDGCSCFCAWHN